MKKVTGIILLSLFFLIQLNAKQISLNKLLDWNSENMELTNLTYYGNSQLETVRMDNWKLIFPHNHRFYEDAIPGTEGLPVERNRRTTKLELYDYAILEKDIM